MNRKKVKQTDLKRINRKSIAFNNREMKALDYYCKKYRVNNQSKFMREAIISAILKKFEDDYPKLFEVEQPTLF